MIPKEAEIGKTHRALRTNLVGLSDLTDDRQQRITGVGCAGHDAEKPGAERSIISNVVGVVAQELSSKAYEIFQSAGSLQCCGSCDDSKDDHHHVDRCLAGRQMEAIDKDKHTEHAVDAQSNAAYTRPDEDQRDDDSKLNEDQCCCHILFCFRSVW